MLGFRSGYDLNMAGDEDLGVSCRFIGGGGGEAGGGGGGSVGGGSFFDKKDSASLTFSSYLDMVVSAVWSNSDICLFRYSAII